MYTVWTTWDPFSASSVANDKSSITIFRKVVFVHDCAHVLMLRTYLHVLLETDNIMPECMCS